MERLALEMLDPRVGDRVLDVGFGGGGLLRALRARGAAAMGADVSRAAVARARSAGIDAVLASVDALPFADASFDKAASLNSLYFWPDIRAALRELARVLKPGGRLVLGFEPAEEMRKWPGHRHGFRLFEVEEVRGLMEGAGFGGIEARWGAARKPDRFCCLSGTLGSANR
jgi:arsenite methyltransferase